MRMFSGFSGLEMMAKTPERSIGFLSKSFFDLLHDNGSEIGRSLAVALKPRHYVFQLSDAAI